MSEGRPQPPLPAVRPARAVDAPGLQSVFARSLLSAAWLPPGSPPDTDFARNSQGEAVWVCADPAGPVLGFVAVYAAGAFIHHLYVAPEARGCGVGRALVDSLDAWLPRPWRLKCVIANQAALAFYARLGWVESHRDHGSQGEYAVLRRF